jgi:hypothetical protein
MRKHPLLLEHDLHLCNVPLVIVVMHLHSVQLAMVGTFPTNVPLEMHQAQGHIAIRAVDPYNVRAMQPIHNALRHQASRRRSMAIRQPHSVQLQVAALAVSHMAVQVGKDIKGRGVQLVVLVHLPNVQQSAEHQ